MTKFEQVSSHNQEEQTVSVVIRIADAAPRPMWGGGKIRWRPERITGRWTRYRRDGGDWEAWSWSGRVRGPKLRKDGSPSAAGESYDYCQPRYRDQPHNEWSEAIEATRPDVDGMPEPFSAAGADREVQA